MTTTDATYRKEICYDRETRDYAMRLDGELVGYARSYSEAEITLDQLVFELLSHGATTCPQRRSLLAPRVCGNCGGQHSIQHCPEVRAALFAA